VLSVNLSNRPSFDTLLLNANSVNRRFGNRRIEIKRPQTVPDAAAAAAVSSVPVNTRHVSLNDAKVKQRLPHR